MGLFDMLGGFATAGASVYEAGKNYNAQVLTNQANVDMNTANNAQNLALTQQQWARDDNSIQRRTADMRAAGLNPVLAAGQGAQSSAPISMQAGKVIAPQTHGLSGAIGSGVAAYSDLVRAKELKDQQKAATLAAEADARMKFNLMKAGPEGLMEAQRRKMVAEAEMAEHDEQYFKSAGLPTSAGASDVNKLMQARAAAQKWAEEHPGVLPSGLLDFLGGK